MNFKTPKYLTLFNNDQQIILAFPANYCNHEAVNFLANHAKGLVKLLLTPESLKMLNLTALACDQQGFLLSEAIEASHGVSTGISTYDRALTIATASSPDAKPEQITTPGHVPIAVFDPKKSKAIERLAKAGMGKENWVFATMLDDDGGFTSKDKAIKIAKNWNADIRVIS